MGIEKLREKFGNMTLLGKFLIIISVFNICLIFLGLLALFYSQEVDINLMLFFVIIPSIFDIIVYKMATKETGDRKKLGPIVYHNVYVYYCIKKMIENENKLIKEISSEEKKEEFKENIKIINNNLYDKFLYEIIHGVLTGTNIPTREPMSPGTAGMIGNIFGGTMGGVIAYNDAKEAAMKYENSRTKKINDDFINSTNKFEDIKEKIFASYRDNDYILNENDVPEWQKIKIDVKNEVNKEYVNTIF